MVFYYFFGFVIFQRLIELVVARRNEKVMISRGAMEFGQKHYPWMVAIHVAFLLSLYAEVQFFGRDLSPYWPVFLFLFLLTQIIRIWALMSLGTYWNTKIIVLPGADVVKKGPYSFLKHPNYLVVAAEIIVIPMLFNAFLTALLFSLLNIIILSIRIPAEEKALQECTKYQKKFAGHKRFVPTLSKKLDN